MTFYHGSPIGNLTELKPVLSEHGKPYIYFATNPLVALLYAVKPVPKPFSFYPYGFDRDGNVVYSEYFENAFEILYKGKSGYLYQCYDLQNTEQPTQINCAYTCDESVKVDKVSHFPDLYEYFKVQENLGIFKIKSFNEISKKEMEMVIEDMENTIEKYNLKEQPQNPMSIFIKKYFLNIL